MNAISANIAKIAEDALIGNHISFPKSSWKDGIVIRTPNWLGDAVMSLPAIKLLRNEVVPPDCAVFVVTIPALEPLFESLDCVDKVITLSAPHKLWQRNDVIKVKKTHAGAVILFNNSLRDAFFFRLAFPFGRIYGASARGRDIFLSTAFQFPHEGLKSKDHHHASRYLSMAYALGAKRWDGTFPSFANIKEQETISREILKIRTMPRVLAVAPGASYGPAKKWSVANFAKVCEWWIREKSGSVIVLGTFAEKNDADELERLVNSKNLANFAGKTDLSDVIFLLRHAVFCVSNDSGIMHLAAAAGSLGIAIFGSTNPFATGPLSEKWNCLYSEKDCSPCLERKCSLVDYECLKSVSPEDVIKEIQKMHIRCSATQEEGCHNVLQIHD
jgi:heptosyltransferase-2